MDDARFRGSRYEPFVRVDLVLVGSFDGAVLYKLLEGKPVVISSSVVGHRRDRLEVLTKDLVEGFDEGSDGGFVG